MKLHWHLGYSKKTACGIEAYPNDRLPAGEYERSAGDIIECAADQKKVTCLRCQRIMGLGKFANIKQFSA